MMVRVFHGRVVCGVVEGYYYRTTGTVPTVRTGTAGSRVRARTSDSEAVAVRDVIPYE